jgi:hypothetical protein
METCTMAYHADRQQARTAREDQIAADLAAGFSHREIGERLDPPVSATAVTIAIRRSRRLRALHRQNLNSHRDKLRAIRADLTAIRGEVTALIREVDTELAEIDINEALAS